MLKNLKDTLLHWSPQLNAINQDLQDNQDRYILNTVVPTRKIWLNGERVYRKVIDFGALPNAGTKLVAHNISAKFFLAPKGVATAGVLTVALPHVSTTPANQVNMFINNTNVSITTGTNFSPYNAYIILEFVK